MKIGNDVETPKGVGRVIDIYADRSVLVRFDDIDSLGTGTVDRFDWDEVEAADDVA